MVSCASKKSKKKKMRVFCPRGCHFESTTTQAQAPRKSSCWGRSCPGSSLRLMATMSHHLPAVDPISPLASEAESRGLPAGWLLAALSQGCVPPLAVSHAWTGWYAASGCCSPTSLGAQEPSSLAFIAFSAAFEGSLPVLSQLYNQKMINFIAEHEHLFTSTRWCKRKQQGDVQNYITGENRTESPAASRQHFGAKTMV